MRILTGKNYCGRSITGCQSTVFPTHGLSYSRVCGRLLEDTKYGGTDALQCIALLKDTHQLIATMLMVCTHYCMATIHALQCLDNSFMLLVNSLVQTFAIVTVLVTVAVLSQAPSVHLGTSIIQLLGYRLQHSLSSDNSLVVALTECLVKPRLCWSEYSYVTSPD